MARFGQKHTRIRYLLVLWLGLLSAVAFLDRTNISVAGIQIGHEFGINNTRLGWVFSAFLVGYAAFQIPAGLLARWLGPRRVLTFAGIWWAIFTAATALVPPGLRGALWVLIGVRLALGLGEATMYPASSQFVERWFPVAERGKANGIIFAGVGSGSGFTPYLVTAIILRFGWRASFWFSACVGLAGALVWFFAARDTPEDHARVSLSERDEIERGRAVEAVTSSMAVQGKKINWLAILSSRETCALTLSYFSFGYVAWIYFAWLFIYLAQVRGLNLKASAMYTMFPFIAMTVGCLIGGFASDAIARRLSLRVGRGLIPGIALVLTAGLLLLGARAQHAESAALILALGAGVLYLAQSGYWAVSADIAGDYTGVVSGIVNMGGQVGGACTASLTPLIAAHFGWGMSFAVAAAFALAGGVAWIFVDPARKIEARAAG